MDRWIEVAVMLGGGLISAGYGSWQLDRLIKRELRAFHERAEQQDRALAVMSAELQFARGEVSRLQSELTCVRFAVECVVNGPPSTHQPPAALS